MNHWTKAPTVGLRGQAVPISPAFGMTSGQEYEVAEERRTLGLDRNNGEVLSGERKHPSWFTLSCLTPLDRCTRTSLFGLETSSQPHPPSSESKTEGPQPRKLQTRGDLAPSS